MLGRTSLVEVHIEGDGGKTGQCNAVVTLAKEYLADHKVELHIAISVSGLGFMANEMLSCAAASAGV